MTEETEGQPACPPASLFIQEVFATRSAVASRNFYQVEVSQQRWPHPSERLLRKQEPGSRDELFCSESDKALAPEISFGGGHGDH